MTFFSRPRRYRWDFDRDEIVADGVMHALGLGLAIAGAFAIALWTARDVFAAPIVEPLVAYSASLVAMVAFSAAYNMWPPSATKGFLRRFDHAGIYLLIAGTYTPILWPLADQPAAGLLLAGLWLTAGLGIAVKLALPGRAERLSYAVYLLLGWSGIALYRTLDSALPPGTLQLLVTGGLLYSVGVVFHLWRSLRYQNAIWHGFVLLAAACHYAAVVDYAALVEAA